jgi:UDP-glucose 4-epimerase
MKSVWITGGKGFIGRNLARHLKRQQCSVYGIGHGFWTIQEMAMWSYDSWVNADIEPSSLNDLATESGLPDIIYHLAGGATVGASIQNPYEDFQKTVDTTARLLEWVRKASPKTKVIGASSAAVYGANHSGQIKESANAVPFSPYGFHKHMLEGLFKSYKATYNLDISVVRLFSIYGDGLEKQLLWDVCNKLDVCMDKKILLNGTGEELRDWLHVSDAVNLMWLLGQENSSEQTVINGGTGVGTNIREISSMLMNSWGEGYQVEFSGLVRNGDPKSLIADMDLANKIGFSNKIPLAQGIVNFVKWFRTRQK